MLMRTFVSLPPRRWRLTLAVLAALLPCLALLRTAGAQLQVNDPATKLELRPGDRISIIGNTLADRMQHDGWLETYLYSRFPKLDLVFRNLGFSGDEIDLSRRLRSANFGKPDQ